MFHNQSKQQRESTSSSSSQRVVRVPLLGPIPIIGAPCRHLNSHNALRINMRKREIDNAILAAKI
jgi:hypothetical protein